MRATTKDAYKLMHDGILALARVEQNGMCVDVERLDKTIVQVGKRIKCIESELKQDDVWRLWKRRFGQNANFGSRAQLGKVLYDEMGLKPKGVTQLGKRAKVDKDALAGIDLPFVGKYQLLERLKKTLATNLGGIKKELVGNRLRPSYSLNIARTYRSGCSNPNGQNFPVRDEEISKMVRSCIVPTDEDHVLVEIDYGSLEVRIAACYHQDPAMFDYLRDPDKDMHRDAAMDVFMLSRKEVTKKIRFYAKNQFVFPEFYGSYFKQCAPNLWGAIKQAKLETADGVPLKEHLKKKGIRGLGKCDPKEDSKPNTFEAHVQEVERILWDERFPVYRNWKKTWFREYEKTGGFDTLTGFRIDGVLVRNDVINYPVQGVAFHCLLWSLIRLVKWVDKKKLRSKIVGQIHDSIIADVHRDELDDYLRKAKQVMTVDLMKAWPWIVVPLDVDAELSEKNWFEKQECVIP